MRFSKVKNGQRAFYSPYVISNNSMYISGQLPIKNGTTEVVPGGIKSQTKQVLQNMEYLLKLEGLDKKQVVMCRIYITDIALWDDFNDTYADYFGNHMPARVVVPVLPLYFGCNIELEAIAEFPKTAC